MTADRLFAISGAVSGFLGVGLGAFAAHGLRHRLPQDLLTVFETGVRYQVYHALALFAVAWAWSRWPVVHLAWSGWLFIAGTTIFSGSLYLLAVTGQRWLGAVTPFGGLCLLAGWLTAAWGLLAAD